MLSIKWNTTMWLNNVMCNTNMFYLYKTKIFLVFFVPLVHMHLNASLNTFVLPKYNQHKKLIQISSKVKAK